MSPRPLATIREVAEYLGLTDKTLRNWAKIGKGPTPSLLGGQYRYQWDEVEAYVRAERLRPSDEAIDQAVREVDEAVARQLPCTCG